MQSRIVICASGQGSHFETLVEASRSGSLHAEICGLIVNRRGIGAIERARRLGVPHFVLLPKELGSFAAWDEKMRQTLQGCGAEWVVLAGFLSLIGPRVLKTFSRRVINIHPALLPKYGGKGMYGLKVHQAVLEAGELETGLTIHRIDDVYDRGEILKQATLKIEKGETAEQLATRLKALEIQIYPKVLNDLVTGRIPTS